jgi:hypothetical protein
MSHVGIRTCLNEPSGWLEEMRIASHPFPTPNQPVILDFPFWFQYEGTKVLVMYGKLPTIGEKAKARRETNSPFGEPRRNKTFFCCLLNRNHSLGSLNGGSEEKKKISEIPVIGFKISRHRMSTNTARLSQPLPHTSRLLVLSSPVRISILASKKIEGREAQ